MIEFNFDFLYIINDNTFNKFNNLFTIKFNLPFEFFGLWLLS